MIIFHFFFDLDYLRILENDMYAGFWLVLARLGQFLFLGLVGVSVALSKRNFGGQLKRGLWIFLYGILVSFVTWIFAGEDYVKFGVLHFIGVVVPLVYFFKARPKGALIVAIFSFILGKYFATIETQNWFLFPVGIVRNDFSSLDFFPIFPWISVVLFGLILGEKKIWPKFRSSLFLIYLGRHSLIIYLIHQPILITLLLIYQKFYV